MFRTKHKMDNKGQAIVEFALIIIVLLLIIFFIIEASRILWAWVTVQNAARAAARYGITGEANLACLNNTPPCADPRVFSIKSLAEENLTGLPLNADAAYEDDYFYIVQVYGVNALGFFQEDYAGMPGLPLVVRVVYNVPIVTPILSGIVENIPVMGQVVVNNEQFGQQGSANQGQGLPPPVPAVPTPGPTPSFTPTPTETATPSPGPTETNTPIPSITATPTCRTQFTGPVVAGDRFIGVTGGLGAAPPITVRLDWIDGVNNVELDLAFLEDEGPGWACPGHGEFVLEPGVNLVAGMLLLVTNLVDNTNSYTFVLPGTPTPTPLPTNTAIPTATPTPSLTPTPSATPIGPYINASSTCWNPGSPNAVIELFGGNWPITPPPQSPINISVYDRFGNSINITTIAQGHGGSFAEVMVSVAAFTQANSPYTFAAQAINGAYAERRFDVPCAQPTIISPTPTPSPNPADLVIVSYPTLVSTPPINGGQPVTFSYVITNTGNINISSQFYVDTYFNPLGVTSDTVPITYSVAYVAVGGLPGGDSRTITMTIGGGFPGIATTHTVVGMVDSIRQVTEANEFNNITGNLVVPVTPPFETPTPTPTPSGSNTIAGIVRIFTGSDWVPQFRATVYLVQTSGVPTPTLVAQTDSSVTGSYFFNYAELGVTYTVYACFTLNTANGNVYYAAVRPGITAPNFYIDMFMMESVSGCPAPTSGHTFR